MATGKNTKKICCICDKSGRTFTCDGCLQSFCFEHLKEHEQELSQQMDNVIEVYNVLIGDMNEQYINKTSLLQIDEWEVEAIAKIRDVAEKARADIKQSTEEAIKRLSSSTNNLSNELCIGRQNDEYVEDDLDRWMKQLEELRKELEQPLKVDFFEDRSLFLDLLKTKNLDEKRISRGCTVPPDVDSSNVERTEIVKSVSVPSDKDSTTESLQSNHQSTTYSCVSFPHDNSINLQIDDLFKYLMTLEPIEQNGPMTGRCEPQIRQMENFLRHTFGFNNNSANVFVQGAGAFQLDQYPHMMEQRLVLYFPDIFTNSFVMTVKEVVDWQDSYKVYADSNIKDMSKGFLHRALRGLSHDGEEAFRTKFVVRISTCPILMEFDAQVIPRDLNADWPHRIKLVSIVGINLAGRKHDVGDILYYVSNWREVFTLDPKTNLPMVYNGRDFYPNINGPPAELRSARLRDSLIRMVRLRLRACDAEGVQVVVETAVGPGILFENHVGIDKQIRVSSAAAIRTVLEDDGSSYKNIRAIVFALPVLNRSTSDQHVPDAFDYFCEEFSKANYAGTVPVLIADQDMHRLTVAIARRGFIVSELNPTDSHCVFAQHWLKPESTIEDKLALNTVGLLVQHHLINPKVLSHDNYHLLEIERETTLDYQAMINHDDETNDYSQNELAYPVF